MFGISISTVTDVSAIVSIFNDVFQQLRMRPCGWRVTFPHSCYCARHCQLSQVVSFLKWGCFHTVWNQILLQSCNVFYPSKKYLYFIRSKLVCFSLCVLVVQKCLESNRHFTLRTHSDVLDRFIGPSKLQMLELCFTWYVYVLWTIYVKDVSAVCCIRTAQRSSVVCYCVQSGHICLFVCFVRYIFFF